MIQVNIAQLVAAVHEAPAFLMPEMDDGTSYLYAKVYSLLSMGELPLLSDLDFFAFDADDINSLSDLHNNVFEPNAYRAGNIIDVLRQVTPECRVAGYV